MANPTVPAVLNAFLDDDETAIVVVDRDEEGVRRRRRERARFATYHRKGDIEPDTLRALKRSDHVRTIQREGPNQEWLRIDWRDARARYQARSEFRNDRIKVYEGDVDPVRLWLTESLTPIATPRRCFLDIETDSRVPFSRKEEMRVLCWAISDADGPVAHGVLDADTIVAEERLLRALWDVLSRYDQVCAWFGGHPDEKEAGFDFFVIAQRSIAAGISIDTRDWLWLDQLVVWRRMNQAESGEEKESMRLEDISQNQLGEGKDKTPDWILERFGDKTLGALSWDLWAAGGKFRQALVDYCVKDTELLRKLEERKGFIALFQSVCEATSVFGSTRGLFPTGQMDGFCLRIGRAKNYRFGTKTHDDDGKKKFKGAFVLAPRTVVSRPDEDGDEWTSEQAQTWRTSRSMTNGILRSVYVCDFASLYPSNIVTWNLSEEKIVAEATIIEACRSAYKSGQPMPEGFCYSPGSGVVTKNDEPGIIPTALIELLQGRKRYSDEAKKYPPGTSAWVDAMAKSTAMKVVINSFYGVCGAPTSRYFNVDASRSTTQNGVWLIKSVIAEGKKRGIETVAGDTDSAFMIGPSREGFETFVRWLNEKHFPKIIGATGVRRESITTKLENEKAFDILVFAAKKRYIGRFASYKGMTTCTRCKNAKGNPGAVNVRTLKCNDCGHQYDRVPEFIGRPEVKGLEYRRGDSIRLAREMQAEVIDLLVGGLHTRPEFEKLIRPIEDIAFYVSLIERWQTRILVEPLRRDEVRIAKTVRHENDYKKRLDGTSQNPAQLQVARILEQRGQAVTPGTKIEFVVVDGKASPMKVIPADDFSGECDRFYLWDTLIYPPTRRLLEGAFPGEDWARFEDVRPKIPRRRASEAPEEQLGLQLSPTSKIDGVDHLAVPTFATTPLVVRVPEEVGEAGLVRLKAALKANPGPRRVEIVMVLKTGAEAVLKSSLFVTGGPKLAAAVSAALAP